MCFAIPYRINRVETNEIVLEDGRIIPKAEKIRVKKGNYVRLIGDTIVDTLSKQEGIKIRSLIKSFNS